MGDALPEVNFRMVKSSSVSLPLIRSKTLLTLRGAILINRVFAFASIPTSLEGAYSLRVGPMGPEYSGG